LRERFSFEENLRIAMSLAQKAVGGLGLQFKAWRIPFSLNDSCLGRRANEAITLAGVVIDEGSFEGGGVWIHGGGEGVPAKRDVHHLLDFLVGDLVAFRGGGQANGRVWSEGNFFFENQHAFAFRIVDFQS
jgi:hypothetical protein